MKLRDDCCAAVPALLLLLGSCSQPSDTAGPTSDAQVLKIYMQYGFKDELDTFEQTLQKDLIADGTIRVPFWLSTAEQDLILQKVLDVGFFAFPDTLKREAGFMVSPDPSPDVLRIEYQDQANTVVWYYPIDSSGGHAEGIIELRDLITHIIREKPEYKILPQARGGYV